MGLSDIKISYKLEILPNNKIMVPGCEPSSAITSDTLARFKRCSNVFITLENALTSLPGSYVVIGHNWGEGNRRQKWLVLPEIEPGCNDKGPDICNPYNDFYEILRLNASSDSEVTSSFDACEVNGQGFCPSPNFASTPKPLPDPYVPEGTIEGMRG
tara:strand:- start:332 stop:802 length:471 start_codon:yes stop_codon:yes gene_type:complete